MIMALSNKSKLHEVSGDPRGLAILEKYIPGVSSDKRMKLLKYMTLEQLQPMSGGVVSREASAASKSSTARRKTNSRLGTGIAISVQISKS